jgi:hypothetical protein
MEHYHEARETLLAGLQVDPLRYDYWRIRIFIIDFIARRYLLLPLFSILKS